jgi:hypothetical protein
MEEKTGRVWPNATSVVPGPECPGKARGIVEGFIRPEGVEKAQEIGSVSGYWRAPPRRIGTVSIRWMAILPRDSEFSADAKTARFFMGVLVMPEFDPGCVRFEQLPWMGSPVSSSFASGFPYQIQPYQSAKLELLNNFEVRVQNTETTDVSSLLLKGAGTLTIAENSSLRIGDYLSECFDSGEFVPRWVPESPIKNITYFSAELEWMPALLRASASIDGERYRVSIWDGSIVGEAVIVGQLKSLAFTKKNETQIRIMGLEGNTTYVVTVSSVSQVSTGAESVPIQFRTAPAPEPPPFNPCDAQTQLIWNDESGGMVSGGSGASRDGNRISTWESGFHELPTQDQSVRVELLSSSRMVVDKMNTTAGSLEQSAGWILISDNASLHLKDELVACYEPHPAHALRRPSQVNASNITWDGFTVEWAGPNVWHNANQIPAAYSVRVRQIGSVDPTLTRGGISGSGDGANTLNYIANAESTTYFNLSGFATQYWVSSFAPGSIVSVVVYAESLMARSQGSPPIVVTIPFRPAAPILECHRLPQLAWIDPTAKAGKRLSWSSGWASSIVPTPEQSVLVDLLGNNQILEIESNVSIGSLHLWDLGSRGENPQVVIKNTSLLTLGAALDECYTLDTVAAPNNLTAANVTWEGFLLKWSPPSYPVTRYSVTIRAAETGRLIRRNLTKGDDPWVYLAGFTPMSVVALTVNAESRTSRSVDSFPPLTVLIPAKPIPPPKVCDSSSVATWAGNEAITSWSSGFHVQPTPEQGTKLNPLGNTIVTVERSTIVGSLQMFAASSGSTQRLVVTNNSLLTITSFLDHCFADTASAPTNMSHTRPVWVPATKDKIGTYTSTLSWLPPSSAGGSEVAEYVLQIREWPTSVRGEMSIFQSPNSLDVWQELKTTNTSLLIHDFQGGNTYFVKIVANSQFGQGSFSESYSMTMPDPIPDCGLRSVWGRSEKIVGKWQQETEEDDNEEIVHLSFDNLANWAGTKPGFKNGAEVIPTAEGIDKFAIFVNGQTEVSELVVGVEAPSRLVEIIIPKDTYLNLTGYSHCIFTRPKPPGQPQNITMQDRSARISFTAPIMGTHTAELETYYIDVLRVFQETEMVDGLLQSEIRVVPLAEVAINLTNTEDIKRGNLKIEGDQVTYTVHELLPFTEYKFRVSAANRQGKGFPGPESTLVRTEKGSPPPPGVPDKVDETATSVIIQWDSPPSIGAPPRNEIRSALQTYNVELQECLVYEDVTASTGANSTAVYTCKSWKESSRVDKVLNKEDSDAEPLPAESIRGLSAGVPYRFRVCASNWFDEFEHIGPWSRWSKIITLKGEPPERVSTLLASNRKVAHFRLKWDLPADNGIPITHSKITWCKCMDADTCRVNLDRCNVSTTDAQIYGCDSKVAPLDDNMMTEEGGITQQESSDLKQISSGISYAFFVCSCNTEGCGETSRPLFDGIESQSGDPDLVVSPAVILLSEPSNDEIYDESATASAQIITVQILGPNAGKGPQSDVLVSRQILCGTYKTPCNSSKAGIFINDTVLYLNNDTQTESVQVTAMPDRIEEADQETVFIRYSAKSEDEAYNGFEVDVEIKITDNDVADVFFVLFVDNEEDYQLRVLPLSIPEGESADFGVVLTSRPTATVGIDLEKHLTNNDEFVGLPYPNLTLSPRHIQFDATDWNVAKRVTTRVEEDNWALPDARFNISLHVASDDTFYSLAGPWERDDAVTVAIPNAPNNDVAGFHTSTTLVTLQEDIVTVQEEVGVSLTSKPTGDHTVTISVSLKGEKDGRTDPNDKPSLKLPDGTSIVFGSAGELVFDRTNWESEQKVSLELKDDGTIAYPVSDYVVDLTLASTDPTYSTSTVDKSKTVNVKVFDKDKATSGWTVKPDAVISLYEEGGESQEWKVSLKGEPPENSTVTITMDLEDKSLLHEFSASRYTTDGTNEVWLPIELPFDFAYTKENYTLQRIVRIFAKEDQEDEDDMRIRFRFNCSQVCAVGNGDVGNCKGGKFNDIQDGGDRTVDGCTAPATSLTRIAKIVDNDAADIKLKMKQGDSFAGTELQIVSLAISEGGTGTFGAVLTSRPTAPVDVYFEVFLSMEHKPPMEPVLDVKPEFITFNTTTGTVDGWNMPHAVTITVNDDNYALNNSQFNVKVVRIVSDDLKYSGDGSGPLHNASYVMLEVSDNDKAGITTTTTTISLEEKEDGTFATESFSISLRSQPLPGEVAAVKIDTQKVPPRVHLTFEENCTRESTESGTSSPRANESMPEVQERQKSLIFSNETWSEAQQVTLCLADDDISWPTESFPIELLIDSQDPTLFHAGVAKVHVSVVDADTETRTRVELAFPMSVSNVDKDVRDAMRTMLKDTCSEEGEAISLIAKDDDIIMKISDTPNDDGDWMCNVEIVLGSKVDAETCRGKLGSTTFWNALLEMFKENDIQTDSISASEEKVKTSETPDPPPTLDKPVIVVKDSTTGEIYVSWTAPLGDKMKSYDIELSNDGRNPIGFQSAAGDQQSTTILSSDKNLRAKPEDNYDDLRNVLGVGKEIYVRVRAIDVYKQEGPYSPWGETAFIIALPRQPVILSSARQMGDPATMILSWSVLEPNETISEIQEFEVQWRANMSMFGDQYPAGEGGSRLISLDVALSGGSRDDATSSIGGAAMRSRVFETVRIDGFKKRPFHIKVRGRNRRGWSDWSVATKAIAVSCRDDEYLTTNLDIRDWHCEPCPQGAICQGRPFETIYSKPGFWRLPWNGTLFTECKYGNRACTGGENTTFPLPTNQSTCSEKYTGIACEGCAAGYSYSKFAFGCEKCIGGSGSQLFLVMGFISALFSMFIGTQVTITSNAKVEAKDSTDPVALFKIMLGHVQITSIASTFNLRWPPVVLALMGFFTLASSATTSVFDIGCHLARGPDATHPFYQRTILMAFGPLIGTGMCGIVVAIAFAASKIIKKIDGNVRKQFAVSWLLMLFLSHPVVTQACFQMFTCHKLNSADDREFLTGDATLECYTESFYSWLVVLGVPMLILFSLGIPVLAYLILWRRRNSLDEPETREFFYFLYAGLNLKFWYWETVLIPLRKVAFIGISVFFSQQGADIAAYAAIILLFAARTAHVAARPYDSVRLVRIERMALTTEFFTFIFGVYLFSPNSPISLYESVTVMIMGINIGFCIYFFKTALVVAREEVTCCQSKEQKAKRKREAEERSQELIRLTFERHPSRRSGMSMSGMGDLDSINLDIKTNLTDGVDEQKNFNLEDHRKNAKMEFKTRKRKKKGRKSRMSAMGGMWKKKQFSQRDIHAGVEMIETGNDESSKSRGRRDSLNPMNILTQEKQDYGENVFLDQVSGRKYGVDASGNTYWLPVEATPGGDNDAAAGMSNNMNPVYTQGNPELNLGAANNVSWGPKKRVTVDAAPQLSENPLYTARSEPNNNSAAAEFKMLNTFPKNSKRSADEFGSKRISVENDTAVSGMEASVFFDEKSGKYYRFFADGTSEWLDGEIYGDEASGKFYRVLQDGTTEWVN